MLSAGCGHAVGEGGGERVKAGFQRMPHLVCPVPLGPNDLTVRYKVFNAACSFGKCPLGPDRVAEPRVQSLDRVR